MKNLHIETTLMTTFALSTTDLNILSELEKSEYFNIINDLDRDDIKKLTQFFKDSQGCDIVSLLNSEFINDCIDFINNQPAYMQELAPLLSYQQVIDLVKYGANSVIVMNIATYQLVNEIFVKYENEIIDDVIKIMSFETLADSCESLQDIRMKAIECVYIYYCYRIVH